jgi:hypothetical protein
VYLGIRKKVRRKEALERTKLCEAKQTVSSRAQELGSGQ